MAGDAVRWVDLSSSLPPSEGWMHSGVAVTQDGSILVAHQDGHCLVRISPDGQREEFPLDFTELHSIALTRSEQQAAVADPGKRFAKDPDSAEITEEIAIGRAALVDLLRLEVTLELRAPSIPAYQEESWRPTSIAVDDLAGGQGDIWVADGYGANLIHRFSSNGDHRETFGLPSDSYQFDCPHGISLSRKDGELEIFVADRGNCRVVVLTADGRISRTFGEGILDSPSSLVLVGSDLYITELFGGILHFSDRGEFVGQIDRLRSNELRAAEWPNRLDQHGAIVSPRLEQGRSHSPHGIASDGKSLFVTEWLLGGRLVQIENPTGE